MLTGLAIALLKDALNEALRDWVANVQSTHYIIGSCVGPAPYPALVRDLQRVIGDALRSGEDGRRVCEVKIAVKALNRMLELGRPNRVRIA